MVALQLPLKTNDPDAKMGQNGGVVCEVLPGSPACSLFETVNHFLLIGKKYVGMHFA